MANTVPSTRAPMSVLAVRPRTKAPPPLPIIPPSRPPTIVPSRAIAPILYGPVSRVPVVSSPITPSGSPGYKLPTQSGRSFVDTHLESSSPDGKLIPIIPNPYQRADPSQPWNSRSSRDSSLAIVSPTVSESRLPPVVPTFRPPLPAFPTQSHVRDLEATTPMIQLPESRPISTIGTMTGKYPPRGETMPVLQPVVSVAHLPEQSVLYSSPVDVASYSISQEEFPLPLEETLQPVVLSYRSMPFPPPTFIDVPYSLDEVIDPNPASPSLRFDPPIIPSPRP